MRIFPTLLLAAWVATGAKAETPKVVTDIPAVHSIVAQILGENGSPTVLIKGSDDPHHFQMRPSQARALSDADLVIWIGEELTPWLTKSVETVAANAISVELLDIPNSNLLGGDQNLDPHAWLDPQNAFVWVKKIADTVAQIDPDNAAEYFSNARTYQTKILSLEKEIKANLADIENRKIIVAHDAFSYFAYRFDLQIVGALTDTEDQPPSAAQLRDLQSTAQNEQIRCAFVEPGQDPSILGALASDNGIVISELDPIGSNLAAGPTLYEELLREMAVSISNCLTRTQ